MYDNTVLPRYCNNLLKQMLGKLSQQLFQPSTPLQFTGIVHGSGVYSMYYSMELWLGYFITLFTLMKWITLHVLRKLNSFIIEKEKKNRRKKRKRSQTPLKQEETGHCNEASLVPLTFTMAPTPSPLLKLTRLDPGSCSRRCIDHDSSRVVPGEIHKLKSFSLSEIYSVLPKK